MSGSVTPLTRILAGGALVGVVLIVLGVLIGAPSTTAEGAYFSRSVGTPVYAGVFTTTKPGLFDPSDGNLWIGAGTMLVVTAGAAMVVRRFRSV